MAERAKREPAALFHSLAHLIDEELPARAYARLCSDAAVRVDGITKAQYGQDLQSTLRDLHERLRTKRYRHQPSRRVHIPKEKDGTQPIGMCTTKDKVAQSAPREGLETIYEQDFLDFPNDRQRAKSQREMQLQVSEFFGRDVIRWPSR